MLTLLEVFDVRNNQLTELPEITGPASSLTTFKASKNQLQSFPSFKEQAVSLSTLHLGDNSIIEINIRDLMFVANGLLTILALDINNLQTVPVLCHFNDTFQLSLESNPIVCDTRIAWMLTEDMDVLGTCDSPSHLSGRDIKSLSYTELGIVEGKHYSTWPHW